MRLMSTSERIVAALRGKFGTDENAPGYIATVVRDGEVSFESAGGMANLETGEAVDADTQFRLASVAKQFTAMCVMMLRERGKLEYDSPITSFLPGLPGFARGISVRHLLSHTSGLMAYENIMPPDLNTPLKDADVLELVKGTEETYFPPGSEFRYSNTGYALLAMIIEHVSGERFPDFLKQNIFDELEMTGTVAHEEGRTTVPNRAYGYRRVNDAWADADQNMTSHLLGDGGIYCSMNNYLKWSAALETDRLIPREVIAQAWQPAKLNDATETPYGMGWRLESVNGSRIVYHPGSTTGFNNYVRRVPHRNTVIVALSNRSGRETHDVAVEIDEILASNDAK